MVNVTSVSQKGFIVNKFYFKCCINVNTFPIDNEQKYFTNLSVYYFYKCTLLALVIVILMDTDLLALKSETCMS